MLPNPRHDMTTSRTPAQLAALAAARAKRTSAAPRIAPAGYRSVEHFLDDTREYVGRQYGRSAELARYLNVGTKTVSRWLSREKLPMQPTIDAIAGWRRSQNTR